MDPYEERLYLEELLLEATRWVRDPDEPYCSVELEIRDRLRSLNGINTRDGNGLAQSDIPEYVEKEVERQKKKRNTIRIRCSDGKYHRVPTNKLHKVPSRRSKTGFEWELKEGERDGFEQCGTAEGV
jgi:hypothetical protein